MSAVATGQAYGSPELALSDSRHRGRAMVNGVQVAAHGLNASLPRGEEAISSQKDCLGRARWRLALLRCSSKLILHSPSKRSNAPRFAKRGEVSD
jgi:hypothetical protein